jgi:transcriptional regulator with XRE-family HTH domain
MDNDKHQPATSADSDGDLAIALERLGTALKEARIQRGLERAALASKLCMGEEQLSALENADQAKLPEPVFVIAQSRRVADALGLDISLLIAPLKPRSPIASSSPSAAPWVQRPNRTPTAGSGGTLHRLPRRNRSDGGQVLRRVGGIALVAGLGAAGLWAWPSLQRLSRQTLSSMPVAGSPQKPTATPAQGGAKAPVPADQVLLSASDPSWLEVRTAGNTVLFKGTFKGERRFPLGRGLKLLAGRPDLVRLSLGEGTAQPLGRIDQIRWVSVPARQPAEPAPAPAP